MEDLINLINAFNVQTIVAMTVVLWYLTREIRNEIKKEIDEIKKESVAQARRTDKLYETFIIETEKQSKRTDNLYQIFITETEKQARRTDKLYEMFIDLIKKKE